ncbi:Uncharacterized protein HZ326_31504 [Fusarium oxysporum f. sp. albedinis]|nr:Uncharacterized protein HZ326_31504 [Fusarium oxysporum f. sp. albedinis]
MAIGALGRDDLCEHCLQPTLPKGGKSLGQEVKRLEKSYEEFRLCSRAALVDLRRSVSAAGMSRTKASPYPSTCV